MLICGVRGMFYSDSKRLGRNAEGRQRAYIRTFIAIVTIAVDVVVYHGGSGCSTAIKYLKSYVRAVSSNWHHTHTHIKYVKPFSAARRALATESCNDVI